MGCDIHLALERRLINKDKKYYYYKFDGKSKKYKVGFDTKNWETEFESKWQPCSVLGFPTHGERIYGMFANLAGVRANSDEDTPEPKGLPEDVSYSIIRGYTYDVNDERAKYCDEHGCDWQVISEEKAKKWNEEYHCRFFELDGEKRIEGPDWHSASWASRQELQEAFDKLYVKEYEGEKVLIGTYDFYLGVIKLMETFEENGDYEVRMVYWFDN